MKLVRAHGLGNDYLVLDEGPQLTVDAVRALCDRHRGVGGDGVLEPTAAEGADYGVRIWNPDGSVAEKSGNGLRIFARYLRDGGAPAAFTVSTGTDVVTCEVDGDRVRVAMGTATFDPLAVPTSLDHPLVDGALSLAGETVDATAVGLGNPHCVLFRHESDLDALPWRDWGRVLEVHPAFPHRTNVQVARVVGPQRVEIRIWERGAGPTLASGSSSCAVAAAAVRTGRLKPGPITVQMPGGSLQVAVSEDLALVLDGPVEVVGTVRLDPRWLAARGLGAPTRGASPSASA